MADDKFRLPASSYEELVKIIRGYSQYSEPAGLDEVSTVTGISRTTISGNAGFLTSIEILEAGQRKKVTSKGFELARALEHEMPDEIRKWWRTVVAESQFLTKVLTAVRIRNGMDESSLCSHIAYSAGVPKKPQFMTGARTVVDILRAAELLKEDNGKIIATSKPSTDEASSQGLIRANATASAEQLPLTLTVQRGGNEGSPQAGMGASPQGHQAAVTININIDCSPGEIDDLARSLRDLLDSIRGDRSPDGSREADADTYSTSPDQNRSRELDFGEDPENRE